MRKFVLAGAVAFASLSLAACDVDQTEEGEMPEVDVDGGNQAVLVVRFGGTPQDGYEQGVVDHQASEALEDERETGAFWTSRRHQDFGNVRVCRGVAVRVEGPGIRNLDSLVCGHTQFATGGDAGGHIERDWLVLSRGK